MSLSTITATVLGLAIKVHTSALQYEVKQAQRKAEASGEFLDMYLETVEREEARLRAEYKDVSKAANALDIAVAREVRNLPKGY